MSAQQRQLATAVAAVVAVPLLIVNINPTRGGGGSDRPASTTDRTSATHASSRTGTRPAQAIDTVLVFPHGDSGTITVDFEEGIVDRSPLPDPTGGAGRPLGRLGPRLVVATDRTVWAVPPDGEAPLPLGEATRFVPDARTDRLWLIDDPTGPDDVGAWTLIDSSGTVLHRTTGRVGMDPVRGVPDGLALETDQGLKVYDLDRREVFFYVGAPHGRLSDVAAGRAVWCRAGCPSLLLQGARGEYLRIRPHDVMSFEAPSAWLSPDGRLVAAVARTAAPATGPIRQLLVLDVEEGAVLARRRLPVGAVHGSWATDGQQFFLALAVDDGAAQIGRFVLGRSRIELREMPELTGSRSFVALPRTDR